MRRRRFGRAQTCHRTSLLTSCLLAPPPTRRTCSPLYPLCTLQWCFLGVLVSIPISIKLKSYWPLAGLGSLGSIADYTIGYVKAFPLKQEMVKLRAEERKAALRQALADAPPPRAAVAAGSDGLGFEPADDDGSEPSVYDAARAASQHPGADPPQV